MVHSDIVWRVNRRPRFTAFEFGELVAADDAPRETLIRDAKFERVARTLVYTDIQRSVPQFLASPIRDKRILSRLRAKLEEEREVAINPNEANRIEHQLAALDLFEGALNTLGVGGLEAFLVSTQTPKLIIEGVSISTMPTVWLRRNRARGSAAIGAALIDFAKGQPLRSPEAEGKARKALEHVACLLHQQVETHRCGDDEKAANDICFVYHLHRGEKICTPANYKRSLRNMGALCRYVASQWDRVEPPPSFDARRAQFRS